jgi:peptidoglycan hydrolase-like protein with peptidoglycan-binding domain
MATAAGAIVVNALGLQSARHPAPFFAKRDGAAPSRAPAPLDPPPVPPTRPPSVTATASLPQPAPRAPARDPIGDMLRSADTTGSAPAAARAEARPDTQRPVAAAQRALVKLGYGPIQVDGLFGQETRQALERFERDRRLAPTGELAPRTVRELSAASGIRVE